MLSTALNSSNLRAASYEAWSATLTIEFRNGSVYEYFNIPPAIYDSLVSADSPGQFHHRFIKNRYPYRRIN